MIAKWGVILLVSGAVTSFAVGFWLLWKVAPQAHRIKRRVGHEQVRVTMRREHSQRLARMAPALVGSVLIYLLIASLTDRTLLAAVVAMGGFLLPVWIREWQETRRLMALSDQLDRAMGMIATSLRRGTPLEGAIAETASSLAYPLGPVLRNMADATVMGITLSQAAEQVRALPAVAGSTDFQVFATEMVICHERGANVVQAFEVLRQVLTARRKYRQQVAEHMGQHLVQSIMITAIGFTVLLAYAAMTPDGLEPLLASPVGQIVLAVSILGNLVMIRWTHLSLLRQTQKV